MVHRKRTSFVFAAVMALLWAVTCGCHREKFPVAENSSAGESSTVDIRIVTSDTRSDVLHAHKHFHDEHQSHEHDHSDGAAAGHTHKHSHQHRHPEPLFGGEIVAIGHNHHNDNATRYHAEVMPIVEGKLRIHFLVESEAGEFVLFPVDVDRFAASVTVPPVDQVHNVMFISSDRRRSHSDATFEATLPEEVTLANGVLVNISRIGLGEQDTGFSFTAVQNSSR